PHLAHRLGHLLAVGADVLHRGGAGAARDAGEGLDPGPPLGHGAGDDVVPHLPGRDPHDHAGAGVVGLHPDPPGRHPDHGAGEAVVGDDEVGAASDDQERLAGRVGRTHRLDQLLLGGGGDRMTRRATHAHRRQVGQPLAHRRTTARARPRTFSPPDSTVSSTVARPASASTLVTRPETVTSAPVSAGTTTGLVNRVEQDTTRVGSPTQSATTCTAAPMVHMPWAMTSGRPTDLANCSSWWIGFWSPLASA